MAIDFRKLTEEEAIRAYYDQFGNEETEILFFIESVDKGFAYLRNKEGKSNYGMPSQWYAAVYHVGTDKLYLNSGKLEWVIDKELVREYTGKLYNFEPFRIYHAKVRKKKGKGNWETYFITELMNDGKSHPQLEELAEEMAKPKVLKDKELGTFKKVQGMDMFSGKIPVEGKKVGVAFPMGNEEALLRLKETAREIEEVLSLCRIAIYENLNVLFEQAGVEPKELPKEIWMDSLKLKEIYVDEDLDFHFHFAVTKKIFDGFLIEVTMNTKKEIKRVGF